MRSLLGNPRVRPFALTLAASFGLAVAVTPELAATQHYRDFVFTDEEGHLVVRFVNTGPGGLTTDQMDEVSNAEFSSMVHDRLRADLRFAAEPVDSRWAESMEPRIEKHVGESGLEFSATDIECRSASCRLILDHSARLSILDHLVLLADVQFLLQTYLEAHPGSFEPGFMITAYDQDFEMPHIKVFLRRAPGQDRPDQRLGR